MKKVNQIKFIQLLNLIYGMGDLEDLFSYDIINGNTDSLINFGNKLSEIFSDGIDEEVLASIITLGDDEKHLFLDEFDCDYDNNSIKIKIKSYLDNVGCLDFDIIKDNFNFNNSYILGYLKNSDKKRVSELVDINEYALLYMNISDLTNDYLVERMKKSDFISKCFGGFYGDNILFTNSLNFDSKEIVELMEEQLLGCLKKDPLCYINFSDLAKNSLVLAEFVYKCDTNMAVYMIPSVRKLVEDKFN